MNNACLELIKVERNEIKVTVEKSNYGIRFLLFTRGEMDKIIFLFL
jgi:hypothetical protein